MKTHNDIDLIWADKSRQMTENEAHTYLEAAAYRADPLSPKEMRDMADHAKGDGAMSVLFSRLAQTGESYDLAVCAFLGAIAQTFGEAVLYAYMLARAQWDLGRTVDMATFGLEVTGMGLPSEETMRKAWEQQKIGGANWLDTPDAWKKPEVAA